MNTTQDIKNSGIKSRYLVVIRNFKDELEAIDKEFDTFIILEINHRETENYSLGAYSFPTNMREIKIDSIKLQ